MRYLRSYRTAIVQEDSVVLVDLAATNTSQYNQNRRIPTVRIFASSYTENYPSTYQPPFCQLAEHQKLHFLFNSLIMTENIHFIFRQI